jgi:S1-C subfamily serine protease
MAAPIRVGGLIAALIFPATLQPQANGARAAGAAAMLERVLPAVVTIATRRGENQFPQAFGYAAEEPRSAASTAYRRPLNLGAFDGSGSGFVIERAGKKYVITNSHVIDDANEMYAFSVSRARYRLTLVGADSYRDVALLTFATEPGPEIATVPIHEKNDLRVGAPVYAIGNPLGKFPYSITSGVISGLNRSLDGFTGKFGYLQTDATIIWGNSGGPLVSEDGEVVGLNSRIHLPPQLRGVPAPQINFALEGQHLSRIVNDLLGSGRVERAFVGAIFESRGDDPAAASPDIVLAGVIPDGPGVATLATHIGAQLIGVNGDSISSMEDLAGTLELMRPGSTARLEVRRGAVVQNVDVTTSSLTVQHIQSIARYIALSWFGIQMTSEASNTLRIAKASATMPKDLTVLDSRAPASGQQVRPKPPQVGEVIAWAGILEDERRILWRIQSLNDLGVVARLVAPSGYMTIALQSERTLRAAERRFTPAVIH